MVPGTLLKKAWHPAPSDSTQVRLNFHVEAFSCWPSVVSLALVAETLGIRALSKVSLAGVTVGLFVLDLRDHN